MKRLRPLLLLALCAAPALHAAAFDDAMKAVAAHNDAAALPLFESALAADPDSLQISNEYRKAVIRTKEYDRAIDFYGKLTAGHPQAPFAWLNYGYTYVDKIPDAGSITQVILANSALTNFSKSIELKKSWIALYTRGNSYLYWPKIFGRAPLGVADLEQAVAIAKAEAKKRKVYVRSWIALGDGYWKTEQPEKAKAAWREGNQLFPGDPQLQARLARDGEELEKYIYDQLDPNKRVDTNLSSLWEE
jgi:tetratricopeptide (TPR) repeat protein